MIDTFEHVLLFAICILIMRLSFPLPTYDHKTKLVEKLSDILEIPSATNPFLDAAFSASFSAAMAVPLWVALEVIWWGMNALLN